MIPENITKEYIEKAIAEIDEKGVRKGRHSSTYDLVHSGRSYPPKLVISIANRFANGEELDPSSFAGGKGTQAFELLEGFGFDVVPKNDPIQKLISDYKAHIRQSRLEDEKYKWELIEEFKGRPNTSADDFDEEIKSIDFSNLIFRLGIGVIRHLSREKPEELRQLFVDLFDESKDLTDRVKSFDRNSLKLYRSLGEELPHHQDERSIATYLTYHNPDKYTFYKATLYNNYCKLIGVKRARKNEKYAHYLSLVDEFAEQYIQEDQELIDLVKDCLPEHYDGSNHRLLVQDIFYQILEKSRGVSHYILGSKYGKDSNIDMFPTMLEQGVIATDFASRLDLTDYYLNSDTEIVNYLKEKGEEPKSYNALKHFLNIKAGDKIAVKASGSPKGTKGFLSIVGLFEVVENELGEVYNYDENGLGHTLNVKAIDAPIYEEYDFGGYGSTVHKLSKSEHIKQIFEQKTGFSEIKSKYKPEVLEKYANYLNRMVSELNLKPNDERVVFSVKGSGLHFTIGQRYCFNLFINEPKGTYGVISKDKLLDKSSPFDGSPPQPFYNYYNEFSPTESEWLSIKEALNDELARTKKSGFRKHNNEEFENFIFEMSTQKREQKEKFRIWLNNKYGEDSGTVNSYIRAMEVLSELIEISLFDVVDQSYLEELYRDLIKEQRNPNGKYYYAARPSFGNNGFFSASISSYKEFLVSPNRKEEVVVQNVNYALNTILYGPPGTGKTYNTVKMAAEIVSNKTFGKDEYDTALAVFNEAKKNGQIEFITFHQNYSYEDFIQGLRPDTENDNQLTFDRKDGVFKVIADIALQNLEDSEEPPIAKRTFEEVFNEFINPLVEGETEEIEVKMKKVSFFITAITNKSIDFRKASGGTAHTLSIATLKKMYAAESVLDIQGLASYYSPLLDSLLKIGKDSSGKKAEIKKKNYVIIIDEINRANISRVFGELITLIEPDKRSHGKIPMEAKLPSGDTFMVPSNLYIIGTMNTADKSIALLDIALRRRFEFKPMYPKYSEDGLDVKDEKVLKAINKMIVDEKGHDFQIGHSYFMDSPQDPYDFEKRMNVKVIPLLLEYFMNDDKAVSGIVSGAIKETGYQIDANAWPLTITKKND